MRFRQSFLKVFSRCPMQAKFHYVDGLPSVQGSKAAFGTCIHASLEQYNHNGNVDAAVELFKENWANPERLGVTPEKWNKFTTYPGLRTKGVEMLRAYHERMRWEKRTVIATEHRFLVPFGVHELEGTADLVSIRASGKGLDLLAVEDYKTNSKKPTQAELTLDAQFTVYLWATQQAEFWLGNGPGFPPVDNGDWYWNTLADMPRRGIWVALWLGTEVDAGGRDEEDFRRLYRLCNEIEKAMAAGVFVPDISAESCGLCDYVEPCGVRIPTPAELREQNEAWL